MRFYLLCIVLLLGVQLNGQSYRLSSPNGQLELEIGVGSTLQYRLKYQQQTILDSCTLGLHLLNGPQLGLRAKVQKETRRSVRDTIRPVVPEKRALTGPILNMTLA